MKNPLLFIVLLLFAVSVSRAQPRPQRSPEDRANRQVDMLEKQLSLTADQKAKIYTVVLAQAQKRDSLMNAARSAGQDRQAMWTKMQELQKENDKKLMVYLTDDQKKKYEQWVEERRNFRREGQGGPSRR